MLALAVMLAALAKVADPVVESPDSFGLYYSGPPCSLGLVDRTFSQFQVNLAEQDMLEGFLVSTPDGEAVLERDGLQPVRLVTNASRADWLLSYPLIMGEIGVWGRTILGSDCKPEEGAFYIEAIFPPKLIQGRIDPRVDLTRRDDVDPLRQAVAAYRHELSLGAPDRDRAGGERSIRAASRLAKRLFELETAMAPEPWRVRLIGGDEEIPQENSVEILLSGSDGSVGVFGHIAAGGGGTVYNVYPNGSDRGASGPVTLADYLFNAQRGHVLRRPTWILRLEGLPAEVVRMFHDDISARVEDLAKGRVPYHPTANNCTIVSLNALSRLGFEVARTRYFTRRFPRPAFVKILSDLPELIADGRLEVGRVEIIYIPQVPIRPESGGAPNRPIRDRSRVKTASMGEPR